MKISDKNYYKPISIHEVFNHNPFLSNLSSQKLKSKNVVVGQTSKVLIDSETGELEGHTVIMKREEKDPEQFVKFYMENLKLFFNISPRAMKVFAYIVSVTKPNMDTIYFDMEDCKKYTGINSKTTALTALSELLTNDFLAISTKKYLYFINPSIFFNGNRVTFIRSATMKNDSSKIPAQKEIE